MKPRYALLLLPSFFLVPAWSLPGAEAAPAKPQIQQVPTAADVSYGPEARQKFDVYAPPAGAGPFPVVFWIHGGGWMGGDKRDSGINVQQYLAAGCAVVSINYRLIPDAVAEHISPPVVAVLDDSRRALQFCRLHAADWHLDGNRIAVCGASAGGATALFLDCEGERADPQAADPVARVSTRVVACGAEIAQASIDPQRISEWVPGCWWGYKSLEPDFTAKGSETNFEKTLADRPKWLPYIQKYSPDALLHRGSPPIYFSYGQPLPPPGSHPTSAELVHSAFWGIGFQKLAQPLGVECYLSYPGHPAERYANVQAFLLHELGLD